MAKKQLTTMEKANKSLCNSHKQTNYDAWTKVEASMLGARRTPRTGIDPNATIINL